MSAARKKVLLRTVTDSVHAGYLPLHGIGTGLAVDGQVDLLGLDGRIAAFPLGQLRWICYVRDFNLGDPVAPERLTRRTFLARPRSEGLWVRLTLQGGDTLEGLAATDLNLVDGLLEDRGLYLTPPDIRSNTQRVFIPRLAITELQLLAVIATPSRPKPSIPGASLVGELFPEPGVAPRGGSAPLQSQP